MQQPNRFHKLEKVSLIALGALLKMAIKYYLIEQILCGICELHAIPILLAIYTKENLI
jgi:hypothetical protein